MSDRSREITGIGVRFAVAARAPGRCCPPRSAVARSSTPMLPSFLNRVGAVARADARGETYGFRADEHRPRRAEVSFP